MAWVPRRVEEPRVLRLLSCRMHATAVELAAERSPTPRDDAPIELRRMSWRDDRP